MHIDPFTKEIIQESGFWRLTGCLDKEHRITKQIENLVASKGFIQDSSNQRIWQKDDQKIVICLVDDIRSASSNYDTDVPYLFDRQTLVITDNFIMCPTVYRVCRLPNSFVGIYCHDMVQTWQPDRNFCFSVNRLDDRRAEAMLEIAKRTHLHEGYVNFNCQHDTQQPDLDRLRSNFQRCFDNLRPQVRDKYQQAFDRINTLMPIKNYDISHEEIHYRSRCNIVIESYGSDVTVALSEKIFRALLAPVPWTLYGGHYAVAYLESLGFDCMSDRINHNHYDQLKEIEDKIHIFVWFSLKWARESALLDQSDLEQRCKQAADHNRQLLQLYQQRWSDDFQQWMVNLDHDLST